jgi:hypothetical protein
VDDVKATFTLTNNIGIAPDSAGDAAGKIYAEYKLTQGENGSGAQISLKEGEIDYIKVQVGDNNWETLKPNTDETLWFNVVKVTDEEEKTTTFYTAPLDWKEEINEATWIATGKEGTRPGTEDTYVEYKLVNSEDQISLKIGEVKLIASKDNGKWVALEANTDETLWFNKAKETGDYEFFVVTKNGAMYKATLNWRGGAVYDALKGINAYLTEGTYEYGEAPDKLEAHLNTLGIAVGEGSDYAALDKTATGGKNRKTAVFYDLNNNKPDDGYDLATLTTYFNDMVATRLVTEESMDLVNDAQSIDELNGITFVTKLLDRFQLVSYETHSDIPVETKISTLEDLVTRYNNLGSDADRDAVLQKLLNKRPEGGYSRSQATTDALKTALDEITFLIMSADDVTATTSEQFTMSVTTQGTVADADKDNLVRFYGVVSGLAASDITFESIPGGSPAVVTDETERGYAGAQEGDLVLAWGPAGGFPLGDVDYSGEGATTYFVARINTAGDYSATFVFYDITGGKQLNAAGETATITVTDSEN